MSVQDSGSARVGGGVKTLAIRLEPDTHAQLSLIAQLRASTITDEIRTAIEAHIESVKSSQDLVGRADSVLEDIEREAAARRAAIATLFGSSDVPAEAPEPPAPGRRSARARSSQGGEA